MNTNVYILGFGLGNSRPSGFRNAVVGAYPTHKIAGRHSLTHSRSASKSTSTQAGSIWHHYLAMVQGNGFGEETI